MWTNHYSFCFSSKARSSSYSPMAACLKKNLIVDMVLGRNVHKPSVASHFKELSQVPSEHISFVVTVIPPYWLRPWQLQQHVQSSRKLSVLGHLLRQYVKLVTILSFCSLTLFSLWMPLLLFVSSLVFSAHISIPYLVQILSRLSSKASSSCSTSAILSAIAMGRPQIGNSSTAYTNLSFMVSLSIRYNPFEKKC